MNAAVDFITHSITETLVKSGMQMRQGIIPCYKARSQMPCVRKSTPSGMMGTATWLKKSKSHFTTIKK